MARPRKLGLDYFPMDTDVFSNRKIRVLQARLGAEAVLFYLRLLCEIYDGNGYFLVCDPEFLAITADDIRVKEQTACEMLDQMAALGLFDRTLYESRKVLTSTGIQRRYQEAKRTAGSKKSIPVDPELWLLPEEDTLSFMENPHFSRKNTGFSENNPPKERKEKESIEKERKGEESKPEEISSPASPPSPQQAELHDYFARKLPPDRAACAQIDGLLRDGVPPDMIRYGIDEAARCGKPWSYARAVIRDKQASPQRFRPPSASFDPSYDLEELERRGLTVPVFQPG